MAGRVAAAALLSGLSLINSYQPAIAQQQQNMTEDAITTTTDGRGTHCLLLRSLLQHKLEEAKPPLQA